MKMNDGEHGRMKITDVKMVSDSCQSTRPIVSKGISSALGSTSDAHSLCPRDQADGASLFILSQSEIAIWSGRFSLPLN
jgi:hypothetical protein